MVLGRGEALVTVVALALAVRLGLAEGEGEVRGLALWVEEREGLGVLLRETPGVRVALPRREGLAVLLALPPPRVREGVAVALPPLVLPVARAERVLQLPPTLPVGVLPVL